MSKRYLIRRIIEIIPIFFSVLIFNFCLIHLAPGDPAVVMVGQYGGVEAIEAARVRWGLDRPLIEQLFIYMQRVFSGDLGYSYHRSQPVLSVIASRIPATLILVVTSAILGISLGVFLGSFSAKKHNKRIDAALQLLSLTAYSTPTFFAGIILILIFSVTLGFFPMSGMISFAVAEGSLMERILDVAWHLFLPATALGILWALPFYFRITRTSVLSVMREDFITCARAQGLDENTVFYKHALRNALLAPLTAAGIWLGFALTGSLMVETVFSWPGMGRLMYEALITRDYPLCMGIFIILSISVAFANLIVDILYSYFDPRITYH